MFRPLSFFIGMRYTRAKRRNHFISFISLTSMVGLALGVLVMIVVLSVMNGFDHELRTRILGMVPHATVVSHTPLDDWREVAEQAAEHRQVVATAPFTQLQGMLTQSGSVRPVLVTGVLPEAEDKVSIISEHMQQGSLADLRSGEFGMVVGEIYARQFGLQIGD